MRLRNSVRRDQRMKTGVGQAIPSQLVAKDSLIMLCRPAKDNRLIKTIREGNVHRAA